MSPYLNDLFKLLSAELTVREVCERHGVEAATVEADRARLVSGLTGAVERQAGRRRWHGAAALVALVGAAIVAPSVASAQLTTFTPGAPAMASAVNGNFQQLKTWLEQKVGPAGTNDITTTGTLTAGSTTVNGTLTASGGIITGGGIFTSGDIVATGNAVFNGISIRVKTGNSGQFSCGQYCAQATGGFQGTCLGGKLTIGTLISDCTFAPGTMPPLGGPYTCLCAVF
ncbi:MAG: hypothetical protein JNK82_09385 [Myxococcaceae bacterium]|nr:hypothetical protein [Myxococcaceae bacterium]